MKNGKYVIKPWNMLVEQYGWATNVLKDHCVILGNGRVFPKEWHVNIMKNNGIVALYENVANETSHYTDEQWYKLLLGPYFEWGEEVEVRDNIAHQWNKESFRSYDCRIDSEYPFRCAENPWRYIRKITTPKIEIDVRINGKKAKLSDISDDTLHRMKELE